MRETVPGWWRMRLSYYRGVNLAVRPLALIYHLRRTHVKEMKVAKSGPTHRRDVPATRPYPSPCFALAHVLCIIGVMQYDATNLYIYL
jgi:hypothetical protein